MLAILYAWYRFFFEKSIYNDVACPDMDVSIVFKIRIYNAFANCPIDSVKFFISKSALLLNLEYKLESLLITMLL